MSKRENKLKIFSALEVANMCGVVNQTAINWIKNGYLKAFTTPGGQYRVYSENLIEFLQGRGMKIPETLLPFVKEKKRNRRIFIIDADRDFSAVLREKILQGCADCDVVAAATPFEAGIIMTRDNPQYILLSDNMADITPVRIREIFSEINGGQPSEGRQKIIYLKNVNRTEDFSKSADLVLVKPPDFTRITAFINSVNGV